MPYIAIARAIRDPLEVQEMYDNAPIAMTRALGCLCFMGMDQSLIHSIWI